jgi:ATP-binding cassette subfamily B multidrug efflux pump
MSEQNLFQQEDVLSNRTRYKDLLTRTWPYVAKQKKILTLVVTLVFLHTIISRILPNIVGYAVDHVIIAREHEKLFGICMLYMLLELTRFIFVIIETYYFQVLGQRVIFDLRSDVYTHIQKLPVQFFDKNPVGRLVTRITNDFGALADLFTAGLVSVFTDSLSLFAIVIAMGLISVKLTLVVMAITPAMLWASVRLSQLARESLRKIKKRLALINSFIAENISGMKVIQLYVRETKHFRKFSALNSDYQKVQLENIKFLAWLYPVLNAFNAITVSRALYYGGILNHESTLAVGAMVAFLTHVQDFLPPLRNILEKYQTFQASLASAERIFTLIDAREESFSGNPLPLPNLQGQIEFRDLSFAYSKEAGLVLNKINLKIQPGQSIAIVGSTGSGKSTMIGLLQRFYDVDEDHEGQGSLLIDGIDIREIDKNDLRRHIGVVQQDFFVFKGTIASNISLGDPLISDERIREAALKANCEELLSNHKLGLHAEVQERGANLSTGEKQLINFARVLAFNPDILILDEATAYIDSHSEALIQQATKEVTKGRTSIIVAHRLSTILECDLIIVLEKGRVAEQGSHKELLNLRGVYKNLYDLQLSKQLAH